MGIFQLESSGMQELVRKMAPTCYDDITAICALYRPGPLGADMDKVYVERKHGRQKVAYKDPVLEPILKDTYGVILYQEQVMQIASAMGGFTLGQADTLRKAMGKKKIDMMAEMKVQFLDGAAKAGLRRARRPRDLRGDGVLRPVRLQQEPLRGLRPALDPDRLAQGPPSGRVHGRHHDHRDAQVRAHHPAHRRGQGPGPGHPPAGHQPAAQRVRRARRARSSSAWGRSRAWARRPSRSIREAWQELGRDFADLFDLCEHVDLQKVNRKVLEGLIHAGAMDRLPGHRRQLLQNLDRALAYGQRRPGTGPAARPPCSAGRRRPRPCGPPWPSASPSIRWYELSKERRAVGFFLSGHPFHEYRELHREPRRSAPPPRRHQRGEGAWVDLVGVITSHTKHRDRHKRVYARAHFEDRPA